MSTWSFYRPDDGRILPARVTVSDDSQIVPNTPPGCVALLGQHDHLSKRVDIITGEVVDWQPAQPDADHEWDAGTKRWRLTAAADAAAKASDNARAQIQRLEAAQLRSVRELALNAGSKAAKDALQAIDDQIAALRPAIMANPPRLKPHAVARAPLEFAPAAPVPVPEPARPLPPPKP